MIHTFFCLLLLFRFRKFFWMAFGNQLDLIGTLEDLYNNTFLVILYFFYYFTYDSITVYSAHDSYYIATLYLVIYVTYCFCQTNCD